MEPRPRQGPEFFGAILRKVSVNKELNGPKREEGKKIGRKNAKIPFFKLGTTVVEFLPPRGS